MFVSFERDNLTQTPFISEKERERGSERTEREGHAAARAKTTKKPCRKKDLPACAKLQLLFCAFVVPNPAKRNK